MISFDAGQGTWLLRNRDYVYAIGLKDGRCHHLGFLPAQREGDLAAAAIMGKALRPEAHVNVNLEGARWFRSGVRSTSRAASLRAEYATHEISHADGAEQLVIVSLDKETGLEMRSVYVCHEDSAAIQRYVVLQNRSDKILSVDHLSSFVLYGPPWEEAPGFQKDVQLVTFPAGWAWEGRMSAATLEQAGLFSRMSRGSWHIENTGSVSSRDYLPFFLIGFERRASWYAIQIEYSASWRFEIGGLDNENGFFVQGGLGNYSYAQWAKQLLPGESFTSPSASIACVQGNRDDVLNAMHRHQVRHLVKKAEPDRGLPVIFNEWQSTRGAVNVHTVERHLQALAGSGVEVYVIDAGWYLKQYQDVENHHWFSHAGDWVVDRGRFPSGIGEAARSISQAGMIPGIWTEIEVAAVNSSAYREKWNLLMRNPWGFVEDDCRRFLYFGCQETRDQATEVYERLIKEGFRYFKIDYNVDCGPGCTNSGGSLGQGLVDHMYGYYAWLDALRGAHPEIIVESCAGGGLRLDYGTLCRSDLVSVTDQDDWKKLGSVYAGVSKAVHPSQMGIWSIVKSTLQPSEAACCLANSMMARMHTSGDVENFSAAQKELFAEAVAFYKRWRDVICDAAIYYHTLPGSLENPSGWLAVQTNSQDTARILLGVWRLKEASSSFRVCLRNVDRKSTYALETFPRSQARTISGETLASGLDVSVPTEFGAVIVGIQKA